MRRARPALVAALLALPLLGTPALADEAPSDPIVSAPESRPALFSNSSSCEGIEVAIDSLSPRVLSDGEDLLVSGELRNVSERTLTTPAILVSMSATTPSSVMELEEDLDAGMQLGPTISASNLETNLAAGASHRFEIRISADQLPLDEESEWGPRVLSVGVFSDGASGADSTIALWDSGAEVSPTRVSALIPWTSQNSAGEEGREAERRSALAIADVPGATLAMDAPLLPDLSSSEGDGEDKGAAEMARSDEAFLRSLLAPGREILALPSDDADPGAIALSGNEDLAERAADSIADFPASLADMRAAAAEEAEQSEQDSPGPQSAAQSGGSPRSSQSQAQDSGAQEQGGAQSGGASTGAPPGAVPGQKPSTSLADAAKDEDAAPASIIRDAAWPTASTFGTRQLDAAKTGVTIAPAGALEPAEELDFTSLAVVEVDASTGATSTSGATGTSTTVLAPNAPLSQILDWRTTSLADELDAEQALRAITAIITRERPNSSRTVFVASERSNAPTAELAARVRSLLDSPWVRGVSFSEMASSEPTDVERVPPGEGALSPEGGSAASTLTEALASARSFTDAASDPEEAMAGLEDSILPVLSAGIAPDEQLTRASQFSAKVSDLRSRVATEPAGAVNLINKSADFPVRVRNDLPWDMTVKVALVPSDARLKVSGPSEATLLAGSVTTVAVPVEAIGSGDVEVAYRISTPDGSVLESTRTVLVRLRAGWEDAITITAAGVFGLLFIGGLVRSIRRRFNAGAGRAAGSGSRGRGDGARGEDGHGPAEAEARAEGAPGPRRGDDSSSADEQMGSR